MLESFMQQMREQGNSNETAVTVATDEADMTYQADGNPESQAAAALSAMHSQIP